MWILGSHNSWSYMTPMKWWMKPIAFMARCQNTDIRTQYEKYGVRCFDLRIRFDKYGIGVVSHGIVEYCETFRVRQDLEWLAGKGDVIVRVMHEVRSSRQYRARRKDLFVRFCKALEEDYRHIHFWCGRELYGWDYDYRFSGIEPTCEEHYASVDRPRLLTWWPWLYAALRNRRIRNNGTDKEILLIDFVDRE